MDRDYRGIEEMNVQALVDDDKKDIDGCEFMLACCWKISVGTSMEILYAWERGVKVVIVVPSGERVSPWLVYHGTVVPTIEAAVTELLRMGAS